MNKKTKKRIIYTTLVLFFWIGIYLIPALVILGVWNLSAKTVSWILLILLAMLGSERLFALLKTNNLYKICKRK